MSVTSIKTEIPTPNRSRFRNKACQQDAEDGIDDDVVPCIPVIDDDVVRGIIEPDGLRAIGDRMISPTDDDESRVGTVWYTEVDDDGDDDAISGKLHIAVAATVGFFIIPQSITVINSRMYRNEMTMHKIVRINRPNPMIYINEIKAYTTYRRPTIVHMMHL